MSWEFKVDLNLAERNLNTIGQELRSAAVRSVNAAAHDTMKYAAQDIGSKYNINPRIIERKLSVREATDINLEAAILADKTKTDLIEFQAEYEGKSGVSVMVTRGMRKILKPVNAASKAFFATPKSGGRYANKQGIYVRQARSDSNKDKHGYPIRRLFGPGIFQLVRRFAFRELLRGYASDRMIEHVTKEFKD